MPSAASLALELSAKRFWESRAVAIVAGVPELPHSEVDVTVDLEFPRIHLDFRPLPPRVELHRTSFRSSMSDSEAIFEGTHVFVGDRARRITGVRIYADDGRETDMSVTTFQARPIDVVNGDAIEFHISISARGADAQQPNLFVRVQEIESHA